MSYRDVRDLLARLPEHPYGDALPDALHASYVLDPNLFPVKHRLLRELDEKAPVRKLVETGAYFGAFLVTALAACPNLTWLYWTDDESYTAGSSLMCAHNLRWFAEEEPGRTVNWWRGGKSVEIAELVRGGLHPDLVHVDGDHSFGGCFLDLVLAWAMRPREIWVDNAIAHTDVARAVDTFCKQLGLTAELHQTTNGLAVIRP